MFLYPQVFPFSIVFNKDMVVTMTGDRMSKWLDTNDLIGSYIDVRFKLRRPILEFTWESVSKPTSRTVQFIPKLLILIIWYCGTSTCRWYIALSSSYSAWFWVQAPVVTDQSTNWKAFYITTNAGHKVIFKKKINDDYTCPRKIKHGISPSLHWLERDWQ